MFAKANAPSADFVVPSLKLLKEWKALRYHKCSLITVAHSVLLLGVLTDVELNEAKLAEGQ